MRLSRPAYHFTPPSGWMNDPNGLVFFEGEWHLFYQYAPPGDDRKHWGHAVSLDLARWEHLPVAIEPDEQGAIWSGSAVVDEDDSSGFFGGASGLVAIFTYERAGTQSQGLAFSRDRGRTWEKHSGNPVLTSPNPNFRDPKVFRHGKEWAMVLAMGESIGFFSSPDLKAWRETGTFGAGLLPEGHVWECPDLFPIPIEGEDGSRWILNASVLSHENFRGSLGACEMRHFIGRFGGEGFCPDEGAHSDWGPDDYAAITWEGAPDGRRVSIGWMSHWSYASAIPTPGWQGQMTIPRELKLARRGGGLHLVQTPVEELKALRGEARHFGPVEIERAEQVLAKATGEAFEAEAESETGTAHEFGLKVRQGRAQSTGIGYDAASGTLFLDRTEAGEHAFSPHFAARYEAPLDLEGGTLRLRIFVDSGSIEVFAQDGAVLLSAQIFPDEESQALSIYASGGGARLSSLDVFEIKP